MKKPSTPAVVGIALLVLAVAVPLAWLRIDRDTISSAEVSAQLPHGDINGRIANPLSPFDAFGSVAGDGSKDLTYQLVHDGDLEPKAWATLLAYLDEHTTDPDIIDYDSTTYERSPGSATAAEDAADVVARVVQYLGERDDVGELVEVMQDPAAKGATESLAHMLSTYMQGFEQSARMQESFPPRVFYSHYGEGDIGPVALVDERVLQPVLDLALATDGGLAELRAGVNAYWGESLARHVDSQKDQPDGPAGALATGVGRFALLEQYVLGRLQDDPTRSDRERDRRAAVWQDAADGTVGALRSTNGSPEAPAKGRSAPAAVARTLGSDAEDVLDMLASSRRVPPADDETAALQAFYLGAALLDRGDLWVDRDSLHTIAPGGTLLSWEEFTDLDATEQASAVSEAYGKQGAGDSFSVSELIGDLRQDIVIPNSLFGL